MSKDLTYQPRKVIHIDMDCFYAAVEIRNKPHLQNKPVIVGGPDCKRGVVCAANYEARKYKVRSAMPIWQALNKCPNLVLLPVDMQTYKDVSESIHQIFKRYTEIIEPLSLDEAFLDVSNCSLHNSSATLIAHAIRKDIYKQEGLTTSAGVSFNKFLAKVASDWHKPNGQFVIRPEDSDSFVSQLPVGKIYGVGRVMEKKLHKLGIITCTNLQQLSINTLIDIFGKYGSILYYLSRGIDNRVVQNIRPIKSVSVEETYYDNIKTIEVCKEKIQTLYTRLLSRLSNKVNERIATLFIKLKFADFSQTTVEKKGSCPNLQIFSVLLEEAIKRKSAPIRLVGIGVKFAESTQCQQLEFIF